eukprot:GHVT01013317.1.p1 GENE.GHVT01013317.1~~GHVT01013317.1.p1  ORF type:complete len:157 (+),score=30.32 GHVT01013317.1:548-1018(+)
MPRKKVGPIEQEKEKEKEQQQEQEQEEEEEEDSLARPLVLGHFGYGLGAPDKSNAESVSRPLAFAAHRRGTGRTGAPLPPNGRPAAVLLLRWLAAVLSKVHSALTQGRPGDCVEATRLRFFHLRRRRPFHHFFLLGRHRVLSKFAWRGNSAWQNEF